MLGTRWVTGSAKGGRASPHAATWKREGQRSLPAGPLRESARSLRRADVLVVTRKSAPRELADELAGRLASEMRDRTAVAVCHLAPFAVVDALTLQREPLGWLEGRDLTAVAAVGAPALFFAQLAAQGATLDPFPFPDHHAFDARDVARLARASVARASSAPSRTRSSWHRCGLPQGRACGMFRSVP